MTKGPRNVIMFMPDQLRYDSVGFTGNSSVKTPNLDKLAARGVVFDNCFAQASVCTQSRCTMFTGQYVHTNGHRSLDYLLQEWEPNMFRTLKEGGVHIAYLGPRGDTFAMGVTEMAVHEHGWLEPPSNFAAKMSAKKTPSEDLDARLFYNGKLSAEDAKDFDTAVVEAALEWLGSSPPEPFCLFLPLIYPHPPFQVEDPYYSMYADLPDPFPPRVRLEDREGYEPLHKSALRDAHGLQRAKEEDWKKVKATYYAMITRLDDQFGKIVAALNNLEGGVADRTYTVFFTDHGEWLGDSGLIEKFPNALDECLTRIPLVIAGPDIQSGRVPGMTEMIDLTPTLYELFDIKEQYHHSGKSLVPLLGDKSLSHKEYAYCEGGFLLREEPLLEYAPFPYDKKAGLQHEQPVVVGRAVAIRNKDWTYIYSLYEPAQLYDRNVPSHLLDAVNLADDPQCAPIVAKFQGALLRWFVETSDYLPWKKDQRFPPVNLKSTKDSIAERKAKLLAMSTM